MYKDGIDLSTIQVGCALKKQNREELKRKYHGI
jgi:hypothetical protein